MSNMTHKIHQINVSLPLVIPCNDRNSQHYHFIKIIPSKHQCGNPHWSRNKKYSLQFLTSIQMLDTQGEAPDPTWDRDLHNMHNNILWLIPLQERPWT